jgi:ADP-ribosyl-[dinitrogen reductase] hydrolase
MFRCRDLPDCRQRLEEFAAALIPWIVAPAGGAVRLADLARPRRRPDASPGARIDGSYGSSETLADVILKAVNLGDDADTVEAVTGQIAGAKWGYASIPNEWKEQLAWRERLIAAATALCELSTAGLTRVWPT